jgi:hypothetical protein
MGGQSRNQEYGYQYKSISLAGATSCGQGGTVSFNLPQNLLEIKNVFTHVIIDFNPSEPIANKKVDGVGSPIYPPNGAQPYMIPMNVSATGNRIELEIDLTQIKDKLVITPASSYAQGFVSIGIHHPNNLAYGATIKLWKIELIYTTQGIR